MRRRRSIWILPCLLCVAGAWLLWHHESGQKGSPSHPPQAVAPAARPSQTMSPVANRGVINTNPAQISLQEWNTNKFAGRLSNTTNTIGQLVGDPHAILLENALIDTRLPLHFVFPKNLQPQGEPGAYIVQAKGPINRPFRAMLTDLGAKIVAYIPNDAYLVRASTNVAEALAPEPMVQAVIPYEPYYKIQPSLLCQAVRQMQLPDDTALVLALFGNDAKATISEIEKLGGQVVAQAQSPFGPEVRVIPPKDWTALATLPGVQIVELQYQRKVANDLARATLGVAADSLTATNYLGLTGSNIIVAVDDTGIDADHPDLQANTEYGRTIGVISDLATNLVDTDGHGTHVAGIIAGDGTESKTVTNAPGSTLLGGTGTNYQFRGMAPGATLFSMNYLDPDQELQEAAALTNALISNNSWVYSNDFSYDLAAASYDAATRDALPTVTGSQPVLFVFAAGNEGNGDDTTDPGGGTPDSIDSPGTGKNVITVGAIQEQRDITATVTNATVNSDGTVTTNTTQPWQAETSTSYRVAGFSSRGNTGIGIEGTYGRFKPDVCAPGTFIISDRSEQWDINSYFYQNPTNYNTQEFSALVTSGSLGAAQFPLVPTNAVGVTIQLLPNNDSPVPFPYLPIYFGLVGSTSYPYVKTNNELSIPPDGGLTINDIINSETYYGFNYAISNSTSEPINFDIRLDTVTTNYAGDYYLVLSNLDQSIGTLNGSSTGPGPYYRYESGTSMAAADVSGVLALMQEFYANAFGANPSPAVLKAMLINGARTTGFYDYQVQNAINYEGWGLVNLPNSLPLGITNQLDVPCSAFIQDQNPTNALATGDSQTYYVNLTGNQPLRFTLAWTDPPGDPAAAIKLVNSLELVVTNLTNPSNPIVYYGNDIPVSSIYNSTRTTNALPVFDSINNVQTVNLPSGAGTDFSVTVMGYRVNVNAVTAQSNNIVQDYALVMSTGVTNSMTVTTTPFVSNPTGDQQVTYLSPTTLSNATSATSYQLLVNQFVGASSPLLGTNTVVFSPSAPEGFGPNNWQVTIGQTNQWHFYVVTNANGYSNAAFITFNPSPPEPDTLSIPREGVFTYSTENASRDADIDLYVSTDPTITNLNPAAISNCVAGTQIGAPPGPNFAGASLGRGTTEFVVDTNSQSRTPDVYYVGVKSEDQMAAEYGFIAIFTSQPFSSMNSNGVQTVYGVPVPMNIPDGSPKLPGKGYVFGLALFPETAGTVTVSNVFYHQNFGDLVGTLTLNGGHPDVLNNHDSLVNPPGPYYLSYDDSAGGGIPGSRPSDGPGSLVGFMGQSALGVWQLTEADTALTQTGYVDSSTITIQPHQNLNDGGIFTVSSHGWWYGYIDVPPGAISLTVVATNSTLTTPPLQMYLKYGAEPTTNDFDAMTLIDNPDPGDPGVWGSITYGPPLESGRYFVGIYDPSLESASGLIYATLELGNAGQAIYSSGDTPIPILDDAVTTNTITVPDSQTIYSMEVALRVNHPRISDLMFHLIGPDGTRDLLVENRGGDSANMGGTILTSNVVAQTFSGSYETSTNVIETGATNGVLQVSYNFWSAQPDELVAYYNGARIFDSGVITGSGLFNIPYGPGPSTQVTIVMNPTYNPGYGDLWEYTVNEVQTNYYTYLVLTEDTNKTTTPIKFAIPPFVASPATITLTNTITDSFEGDPVGYYTAPATPSPWTVVANRILVTNYPAAADGTKFAELLNGAISNSFPTVPGRSYRLDIAYRAAPGASGPEVGQIQLNGQVAATFTGADFWQTNSISFTATQNATPVEIASESGSTNVWVDNFILGQLTTNGASDLYYLPEEPLDVYDGRNAAGPWTLEIQDTRAGATNPPPELLSWQLRFIYVTTGANPGGIPSGTTVTNVIPPGSWAYYPVNVPTNADYATNILLFASTNLDVWFNANNNPTGSSPPDYELFGNATNGSATLSTFSAPKNIVPGGTYYIGLYNPNPVPVTNGFEVDFHYFTVSNAPPGVPITNVVAGAISGDGVNYYSFTVPPNADYATNLLVSSTAPVNVWFNQTKPPVCLTNSDYLLISDKTSGVFVLSAGSTPPLLPGATYNIAIQNTNSPTATNVFQVDFHFLSALTNNVPITNTVSSNSFVYYQVQVPTNADYATNLLLFADLPLNVWFNQYVSPTGTSPPDSLLITNATNGVSILSAGTTPPLVPGATYFLGVQNTNAVPVNFGLEVDFHLVIAPAITGPTITSTNLNGTNGFLLQWSGPTNYLYTIQWTTNLAPPTLWNTVTNPIINLVVTPTNGDYSWFDDGSQTGGWPPFKFYRVLANFISPPITNSAPVTNNIVAGAITPLTVTVPADATGATNVLVSATGPINVWFNQTTTPTGDTNAGDVLLLSGVTNGNFLLTGSSTPPLVPGANYYLGLQNPGTTNVSFVYRVDFGYAAPATNAPAISTITFTNMGGTNGILLTWYAPTNYRFQVQWTTNLLPGAWQTIPGVVLTNLASFTPTNGIGEFQYFDDGSQTGGFGQAKFYRLIAYPPGATIPSALSISSVLMSPGGLHIQWSGSTNYTYQVAWTTNLALPMSGWMVLSNLASPTLTYSSGVFTFTDGGTNTGGAAEAKFFRVLLLP